MLIVIQATIYRQFMYWYIIYLTNYSINLNFKRKVISFSAKTSYISNITTTVDCESRVRDTPSTGSVVRTVCNDTYTTDTYLVPISSHKITADDKADDNSGESCNHVTPLLDLSVHRKGSVRDQRKLESENQNHSTSIEHEEPIFKRKAEGSLTSNRFSKNKQTVYPCESVTLLSDSGASRCFETAEITLHQETTTC